MVSKTICKRCGRLGSFNEVKLYPLPHDPSKSMFLCEACYRKMLFEKNREKVQTKPCHQCGRIIPVDARLCPYCGLPLRSESLRGSRRFETMCGFCGARFIGSPTVCPSCGKRIMQPLKKDDSTWYEGTRVTKNMVMLVVLIVGVVVGIIVVHMYLSSLLLSTEALDVSVIDFSLSDCHLIDHNGRTAVQVFFSSNVGGEIRIADSFSRVLGYVSFRSSDNSKIVDIAELGDTVDLDGFTVVVVCNQMIVFSDSFFVGKPLLDVRYLEVTWLFKQDVLDDVIESMRISVVNSGGFPVYITSVDVCIDVIEGPYPNMIQGSSEDNVLLPGESAVLNVAVNIPGVFHNTKHYVTVFLKDSQDDVLCEFTQQCSV